MLYSVRVSFSVIGIFTTTHQSLRALWVRITENKLVLTLIDNSVKEYPMSKIIDLEIVPL